VLPIETGIPLPTPKTKPRIYPLKEMKKGDSFFLAVPADPPETFEHRRANRQKRMGAVLRTQRVRSIGKFIARQVENGVRVWRIG
jgi:hypothetical protein